MTMIITWKPPPRLKPWRFLESGEHVYIQNPSITSQWIPGHVENKRVGPRSYKQVRNEIDHERTKQYQTSAIPAAPSQPHESPSDDEDEDTYSPSSSNVLYRPCRIIKPPVRFNI